MLIKPVYDYLEIYRADDQVRERLIGDRPAYLMQKPLFLLNGEMSYIVAGAVSWHEDHGDHHAPSKFGPFRGTE
jgi:hypothetical protein